MKVVFLVDISHIAEAGDVKDVADGYARNYLIPKKLAALVSAEATSKLEAQLQAKANKQTQLVAELTEIANQLEGKEIVLQAKVGAKDRLYGSITSADIAAELEKVTGITVDKRKIELDEPIRKLGSFDVAIRLGKDTMPKVKVVVSEVEADSSGGK
ncbi:MAG: 50S ribosomal protein L9 [Dehalococcoidales bacterium]|nr:50S ribosomal protein L9 [Dehalococcoidales bacterium]